MGDFYKNKSRPDGLQNRCKGCWKRPKLTAEERFWRKVKRGPRCWDWTGSKSSGSLGYGTFGAGDGRTVYAHRYSFEIANGPIPDGGVVLHACDRAVCVNPAHLSIGTQAENVADMHAKGRGSNGS